MLGLLAVAAGYSPLYTSSRPALSAASPALRSPAAVRAVLDLPRPVEGATVDDETVGDRRVAEGVAYADQFEELFSKELATSTPVPKPSNAAQAQHPKGKRIAWSNVYGTLMRPPRARRSWSSTDIGRGVFFSLWHVLALFAPFMFSWRTVVPQFLLYVASGMGITYSYHRQLAHRAFRSPKWLEYLAAHCGMMAMQGGPIEWVSDHRYHHLHTETPLDPHSSYEGFYWSHLGWMLDSEVYEARCSDRRNVADLEKQPFYRFAQDNYLWYVAAHWGAVTAIFGLPGLVWRAFFTSLLFHVTWFVNSACHAWGAQPYRTGDQSRNNWWVGFLAFGEGWHNNHHKYPGSARQGFFWWEIDITYYGLLLLQRIGLISDLRKPPRRVYEAAG